MGMSDEIRKLEDRITAIESREKRQKLLSSALILSVCVLTGVFFWQVLHQHSQ